VSHAKEWAVWCWQGGGVVVTTTSTKAPTVVRHAISPVRSLLFLSIGHDDDDDAAFGPGKSHKRVEMVLGCGEGEDLSIVALSAFPSLSKMKAAHSPHSRQQN
jgi:hypothetical protein